MLVALQQATSLIKGTYAALESLRNDEKEYENIFKNARTFAEQHDVVEDFEMVRHTSDFQNQTFRKKTRNIT